MKLSWTFVAILLAAQAVSACGGPESVSESESNGLWGSEETAESEFQEALKNPAYFNFPGRGGTTSVRIGVVRLNDIPVSQRAVSRIEAGPAHKAMLDTIAAAEGTSKQYLCGDRGGYNVAFSGACFNSFLRHPARLISSSSYRSDASGRYQFMSPTWNENVAGFLTDLWQGRFGDAVARWAPFGPRSQDTAAALLIKHKRGDTGAWEAISTIAPDPDGKWKVPQFNTFKAVLAKLAPEWASLPNLAGKSAYAQPVHPAGNLWEVFKAAYPIYAAMETSGTQSISQSTSSEDAISLSLNDPEEENIAHTPAGLSHIDALTQDGRYAY